MAFWIKNPRDLEENYKERFLKLADKVTGKYEEV